MDLLSVLKQVVEIGGPLVSQILKLFFDDIRELVRGRSKTTENVTAGFVEIAKAMEQKDTQDRIDVERLRAFAELTREVAPMGWIEYAFYRENLIQ